MQVIDRQRLIVNSPVLFQLPGDFAVHRFTLGPPPTQLDGRAQNFCLWSVPTQNFCVMPTGLIVGCGTPR